MDSCSIKSIYKQSIKPIMKKLLFISIITCFAFVGKAQSGLSKTQPPPIKIINDEAWLETPMIPSTSQKLDTAYVRKSHDLQYNIVIKLENELSAAKALMAKYCAANCRGVLCVH